MWIAASVPICAAVQWPLASLTLWGVLCLGILQVALETQRKKNTDSISSRHSASVPKWRQYTAVELGFDPNAQPDARCGAWAISPQRHCCGAVLTTFGGHLMPLECVVGCVPWSQAVLQPGCTCDQARCLALVQCVQ